MIKQAAAISIALASACTPEPGFPCSDVSGTACTYAGVPGPIGVNRDILHRQESRLSYPIDVSFSPVDGSMWIVDWNNHIIRRTDADDNLVPAIGNENEGDGTCVKATPNDPCDNRDYLPIGDPVGAPGPEVSLNHPTDVVFLPNGDAVVAAWHNNKVRYWDATTGIVKVLAGNNYGYLGDDGPAYWAEFNLPKSVVVDPAGRIYVVDSRNQKVRAIAPDGERIISRVIGDGTWGYYGDGGPALDAKIYLDRLGTNPEGSIALGPDYVYLADTSNHRIRRVSLATGIIDCLAGNGQVGLAGDGGAALDASFNKPVDIELGRDGRLYVADSLNFVVRAIDLTTGIIETVAGTGEPCPIGQVCLEAEEGLPATQIRLNRPSGIAFDATGNLYIADQYNNRIVRIAR